MRRPPVAVLVAAFATLLTCTAPTALAPTTPDPGTPIPASTALDVSQTHMVSLNARRSQSWEAAELAGLDVKERVAQSVALLDDPELKASAESIQGLRSILALTDVSVVDDPWMVGQAHSQALRALARVDKGLGAVYASHQEAVDALAAQTASQEYQETERVDTSPSPASSQGAGGDFTPSSSVETTAEVSAPVGPDYTLYVPGFCGEESCVQSSVDSTSIALISIPWAGLTLVAGHSYGPAGIVANFTPGDTVRVDGNAAGLYRVTSTMSVPYGTNSSQIPSGFAFQTCVGNMLYLVYATQIG